MNWRAMILSGVLVTGLTLAAVPSAHAKHHKGCDDQYYDSYDRYGYDDRYYDDRYYGDRYYGDRSYDDAYYDRRRDDRYYDNGYGAYESGLDYNGDGRFKWKSDWPALLGVFLNTQVR